MIKKIYLLLLFFTGIVCLAQIKEVAKNYTYGVEVKIKIFQHYDENGKYSCSSMAVDVINNTGKNIYIPDLDSFTRPDIYKKVDGKYSEGQYFIGGKTVEEHMNSNKNGTPPHYSNEMNEISEKLANINQEKFINKQKEFKLECSTGPEKLEKANFYLSNIQKYGFELQGFLKPNETIENYHISDFKDLEKRKGDYKIWINTDEARKLVDKRFLFYPYPAEFYHDLMGYELFLPENMTSNVVYITIL
jgi:hypothetical protein